MRVVAERLGIPYTTYVSYDRGDRKLPLEVAAAFCREFGVRPEFMLYGQEPIFEASDAAREARCRGEPPHGYDLIRLPRGDPRRLSPLEADVLEKILVLLRAKGESEH